MIPVNRRSVSVALVLALVVALAPGFDPSPASAAADPNGASAVAYSPDGQTVAVGGEDGSVFVFNANTGSRQRTLTGHLGAPITTLAFSPKGDILATGSRDSTVQLWNTSNGKHIRTLSGHEQPVLSLAFSPDGAQLLTGGEDSRAVLWEVATGKLKHAFGGNSDFVTAVAVSPDGTSLATATRDARITLRDPVTYKVKGTLRGHSKEVTSLSFTTDGQTLASGSADRTVKLWDVAGRAEKRSLTGHSADVTSVAFTKDGSSVASGSDDGTVRIWNPSTGAQKKELAGSTAPVAGIAFKPDGTQIVEGQDDGVARNRNVTSGAVVASMVLPDPAAPPAEAAPSAPAPDAARLASGSLASGPGGPILVATSSADPFSSYYAEILRAEGLNSFTTMDLTAITASDLTAIDVVILAARPITSEQVGVFTEWVNAGGNLIAMRPDAQLEGLLGLKASGTTLSEGYLKVDTARAPGNGIVGETIQFHGTADKFTLDGARGVATLYSDATTATPNPAVSLRDVGTTGGQAAAFTYDLAKSVVFTRQGNPAWSGQERDGSSPVRSDDLYFGNKAGDAQADWIDLDKVAIPQADEQQRLLVNLILTMNEDRKPLPRFWYLPRGLKAAVVMTGDDHGNNGTEPRFNQFIADSPAGCSVADWECIRGTSYVYPSTPLTSAKATNFINQGFEVGLHLSTRCQDWTESSLTSDYTTQLGEFAAKYPGVPRPTTNRTHCIAWSDWSTQAKVELANGIRLDTNYYYWPPSWIQDRAGFMTGSGIPMRFADPTGEMIDVYQAATQLTDESGQSYPATIETLLDRAQGAEGYYGAFTINAHTDVATIPESTTVVAAAKARGVPVITSKQLLDWVDARNASSFSNTTWSNGQLSFTVAPDAGARNLDMLVPARSGRWLLSSVTRDGSGVTYDTKAVKGADYAFVRANAGSYVATYTQDTTAPTVTAKAPADAAKNAGQSTPVTATFDESLDPTTVSTTTFELRGPADALVPAAVSYHAASRSARLTPTASLAPGTVYQATIKGGGSDPTVRDVAGNALETSTTWSFTTATGPACPCSIWPATATPTNKAEQDPNAVELGVKFRSDVDGFISGVRFWKSTQNTGTHTGTLWTASGQKLATATFTNETASGWQEVSFSSPVEVTANTTYVASYFAPRGYYSGDNGFFSSVGVDNAPLRALSTSAAGGNGVYAYRSTSGFPSDTWQGSNYWVDVVFTTSTGPDTTPPTVTATIPGANTTGAATNGKLTATFNEALDPATVSAQTAGMVGPGGAVAASVSYDAATKSVVIQPNSLLAPSTPYTATIKGGEADPRIKDVAGNALAADTVWNFTTAAPGPCDVPPNEIVAENCRTGSPASQWDITGAGDASIQGFATDISVDQGQRVDFKVDTTSTDYSIDIYRLGYYNGDGARKVATVQPTAALPQTQPACLEIDGTTNDNLIDCGNWSVSASWAVPTDAVSGVYIARPKRADNGGASHIIFIVRDDDGASDLLFQTSDTTWQAYNQYGGYSLYNGPSGHAHKVSYNRPFTTRATPTEDNLFNAEYPMIRWIERNGYDVSYVTGVDSHRSGAEIGEHKTFLSIGHDEYWSGEQRANVEAARDAGVHLAFLSGNEVYWKTRWEPSTASGASAEPRTLVSYKEGAAQGSAEHYDCYNKSSCDPHPTVWTGLWRENQTGHDGGRPENALTGQISWGDATGAVTVPAGAANLPFWRNAGLSGTTTLANGTLGYEFDWEQPAFASSNPAGRITVSDSTLAGKNHKMSLYRAPSGALVFGAGTVQWSWGLDSTHDRGNEPPDPRVQQATINVLADMDAQPATLQSGRTKATKNADSTAPSTTITSPGDAARVDPSSTVTVSGTATDSAGRVLSVEVSTDGGTTWKGATGTGSWTYAWTTPTPGTATLKARAVDDSANLNQGATVASVTVTVDSPQPPGAPTSLSATLQTGPKVSLTWTDNATTETGFVVQRSTNGSAFTQIAAPGPRTTTGTVTYVDTTVVAGTSYSYQVAAVNAGGTSAFSNTADISVPVAAPAAPTSLTRTLQIGPTVSLKWTDNATTETGFEVQRSTDNGVSYSPIATPAPLSGTGTVTYVDTTVVAGTAYRYRVAAVNAGGTSTFATSTNLAVPAEPAAPSNFTANNGPDSSTRRSVILTWTDNSTNETGFRLERSTTADFATVSGTNLAANITTLTQTGLVRNTNYYYRIRTRNGTIISGVWVSATPLPIRTNP